MHVFYLFFLLLFSAASSYLRDNELRIFCIIFIISQLELNPKPFNGIAEREGQFEKEFSSAQQNLQRLVKASVCVGYPYTKEDLL